MRLLVDCHCFDAGETQGLNTYIRCLYKSLISIANDITFVFAAQNLPNIKRLFGHRKNIEYVRLGDHSRPYRLMVEYPRLIRKHKIDVAHFQYVLPWVTNCKTIVTVHDILFEDYPEFFPFSYKVSRHFLFKESAKRADMLLTVSDYSRKRISDKYNIPENEIYITHNGVSDDFRKLNNKECADYLSTTFGISNYILYVSRFEPRKKQVTVLQAYKDLRLDLQGLDLVLIGIQSIPDPLFNQVYEECSDEIKSHIHILNHVPYAELLKWYAGCRLFVYPSEAEGFGIPPLEAGACGVPVICNNKTAMGDFTFFGDNLISTDNTKLLHSRMLAILEAGESTENLNKVKEDIYQKYSWDNIAREFYHQLKGKFIK
ncbi:MAG: glycosyltransferase family 4 protein [Muribaculaceae bacterium]|nr:glycosyltransferase family 4 protein [Muribaculaceae bacterium]